MPRPPLTQSTSPADFLAFYWLKDELVSFCRQQGLSTSGSKGELTQRIANYLANSPVTTVQRPLMTTRKTRNPKSAVRQPDALTRQTVIMPGMRCSQELRAFFEAEIGPTFHFNSVMRAFIQHEHGKTLQAALEAWYQSQSAPKQETEIGAQFEYNRHMRQFFKDNPGKSLQDAIAAWNEKKFQRK